MKESENVYALWCSGRTCVEGMLVELKFLKRQDLISSISNMLKPSSDQIVSICISNHWDEMGFIYIGTWIVLYETISNMLKPFSDQIVSTCISNHWDGMGVIYYWYLISSTSNMLKPFSDQIVSILVTIEGELVCILGLTTLLKLKCV